MTNPMYRLHGVRASMSSTLKINSPGMYTVAQLNTQARQGRRPNPVKIELLNSKQQVELEGYQHQNLKTLPVMEDLSAEDYTNVAQHFLSESASRDVERYSAFFRLYRDLTAPRIIQGSIVQIEEPILTNHERLQAVVSILRTNPQQTRQQFRTALGPNILNRGEQHATGVVVQLGFMLNCNLKDRYSRGHRIGDWTPCRWEDEESFHDFITKAIPEAQKGTSEPQSQRHLLTAWKFTKRCKIKLDATDNISEHLLYDPLTKRLRIFHHTSWLHAQLERLDGTKDNLDLGSSLKVGALPRQLILETLDSFYRILFPIATDTKGRSRALLNRLIQDSGFDNHALVQNYSHRLPPNFQYCYWAARLKNLSAIARKPPPPNKLMSYLERHTKERNVLWIAIIGLFLSATFGLLSCLIGAAQLYVAVVALKLQTSQMAGS